MTLNEYQQLAARTINKTFEANEMAAHALHGLASEVGEIHGIFQKILQGHKIPMEYLIKEAGDVLWMLAELMTSYDIELEDVAQMNIDKLRARYPDGFDAEHSLHRKVNDV